MAVKVDLQLNQATSAGCYGTSKNYLESREIASSSGCRPKTKEVASSSGCRPKKKEIASSIGCQPKTKPPLTVFKQETVSNFSEVFQCNFNSKATSMCNPSLKPTLQINPSAQPVKNARLPEKQKSAVKNSQKTKTTTMNAASFNIPGLREKQNPAVKNCSKTEPNTINAASAKTPSSTYDNLLAQRLDEDYLTEAWTGNYSDNPWFCGKGSSDVVFPIDVPRNNAPKAPKVLGVELTALEKYLDEHTFIE